VGFLLKIKIKVQSLRTPHHLPTATYFGAVHPFTHATQDFTATVHRNVYPISHKSILICNNMLTVIDFKPPQVEFNRYLHEITI
jgi:hypothetical protein